MGKILDKIAGHSQRVRVLNRLNMSGANPIRVLGGAGALFFGRLVAKDVLTGQWRPEESTPAARLL
jgi:hypothetical protein